MYFSILAIAFGAFVGAVGRWLLGLWLNASYPALLLGTLAANLLGGYLIGLAMACFGEHPDISPLWRLGLVTGLSGGLTTFSTFSAEVVENLLEGRFAPALAGTLVHVLGSFTMTAMGIATMKLFSFNHP